MQNPWLYNQAWFICFKIIFVILKNMTKVILKETLVIGNMYSWNAFAFLLQALRCIKILEDKQILLTSELVKKSVERDGLIVRIKRLQSQLTSVNSVYIQNFCYWLFYCRIMALLFILYVLILWCLLAIGNKKVKLFGDTLFQRLIWPLEWVRVESSHATS